jgi:hypothetical protein
MTLWVLLEAAVTVHIYFTLAKWDMTYFPLDLLSFWRAVRRAAPVALTAGSSAPRISVAVA